MVESIPTQCGNSDDLRELVRVPALHGGGQHSISWMGCRTARAVRTVCVNVTLTTIAVLKSLGLAVTTLHIASRRSSGRP